MSGAIFVHLPKEHLDSPVPRHLRKLVHRGDEKRGKQSIYLLVDYHDRQPFVGRLLRGERAPTVGVSTIDEGASVSLRIDLDMFGRIDFRAAPGAMSELGW